MEASSKEKASAQDLAQTVDLAASEGEDLAATLASKEQDLQRVIATLQELSVKVSLGLPSAARAAALGPPAGCDTANGHDSCCMLIPCLLTLSLFALRRPVCVWFAPCLCCVWQADLSAVGSSCLCVSPAVRGAGGACPGR